LLEDGLQNLSRREEEDAGLGHGVSTTMRKSV
jgi:hypothetical protein